MIDAFKRIWKCKSKPNARVVGHNLFIFYFSDKENK